MATELRRGNLLVIFLTVFIDLLGFGMVLPLLPLYAAQFDEHENGWLLGALMASFSAMQFLFAPWWGRLSDRTGRRPVLLIGLLGSVVFYALFGWATIQQSLAWLFVSRIGAGICGATISTAQAYIADTTSKENRSRGMALIGMAFGLGFTFGPLLGYLALPSEQSVPGPLPGFVAAGLSAVALLLAWFRLPESLNEGDRRESSVHGGWQAWRSALAVPSIGLLVMTIFLCVFSFTNFETTLGLLIKGRTKPEIYHFDFKQVCWTFAYIGFVLALVQGGLVRRLSGKVPETRMALIGAGLELVGFGLLTVAVQQISLPLLFSAVTIVVTGFAFITPSLNGLLSRRTHAQQQGSVLGVGQSASALARIIGSAVGIPLLMRDPRGPALLATGLMVASMGMLLWTAKHGQDHE